MEEEEKGDWGNGIGLEEGLESWVCFRIKEEKGLRALVVLSMADWRRSVRDRDLSELAFNMFIFFFLLFLQVSWFLGFWVLQVLVLFTSRNGCYMKGFFWKRQSPSKTFSWIF